MTRAITVSRSRAQSIINCTPLRVDPAARTAWQAFLDAIEDANEIEDAFSTGERSEPCYPVIAARCRVDAARLAYNAVIKQIDN
jgi:hypothetical protein